MPLIGCKARLYLLRVFVWLAWICGSSIFAHEYLFTRLYEFDTIVYDYTQRSLSDNLSYLLLRKDLRFNPTGYSGSSGNLQNVQVITDFSQIAGSTLHADAPEGIDRDLWNAERFVVKFYESLARRWEVLNPIPELLYVLYVRSAAYPFLFSPSFDMLASDKGTFPFTEDLQFRKTLIVQRQFGLAFRILF